jgi:hypothetical protein
MRELYVKRVLLFFRRAAQILIAKGLGGNMAGDTSVPRRKRQYRNAQRAVEYLLGYPAASNEQVVKATGCSPRSVSRARSMLVATGQLSRSYFDRHPVTSGSNVAPQESPGEPASDSIALEGVRDPSALEKAVREDHGPPLTTDQMRQRYSAIARYAQKTGEFSLEMSAMQSFARLEAQTGAQNRLGPAPPHTREDRRDRVIPILQAAGPSIVAEAVSMAYDTAEITDFLTRLGGYVPGKAENGVSASKDRPSEGEKGTSGRETAAESAVAGEG